MKCFGVNLIYHLSGMCPEWGEGEEMLCSCPEQGWWHQRLYAGDQCLLGSLWWSCEHPRAPDLHSELQCQTPLLSPSHEETYKCHESWASWRTAPSMQGNRQLVTLKLSCFHPAVDLASDYFIPSARREIMVSVETTFCMKISAPDC